MSEICKRDFLQPDKPTNRLGSQISFYYGQQQKNIRILGYNQSQNSMTAGLRVFGSTGFPTNNHCLTVNLLYTIPMISWAVDDVGIFGIM